jgi:hypothetical protein
MQSAREAIVELKRKKSPEEQDKEEILTVQQLLEDDGLEETDELFLQTKTVCEDRIKRQSYLACKTKEGRAAYVRYRIRGGNSVA